MVRKYKVNFQGKKTEFIIDSVADYCFIFKLVGTQNSILVKWILHPLFPHMYLFN